MEGLPQLLNLIPKKMVRGNKVGFEVSEDKKLELRLGLPEEKQPLLSLFHMSSNLHKVNNCHTTHGAKRGYHHHMDDAKTGNKTRSTNVSERQNHKLSLPEKVCRPFSPFPSSSSARQEQNQKQPQQSNLLLPQHTLTINSLPVKEEETSQPYKSQKAELQCKGKKASQKRIEVGPAIGWPPVCSFRKNLSTNSLPMQLSTNKIVKGVSCGESKVYGNSQFVKINMDGIPIGRKIDLGAYDNYEKLSSAVEELFRGLIRAQRNFSADVNEDNMETTKVISGLLDGNGEYTLVYEDSEGDRMLVGDVPWHMFVSSAKRLRVLKKSELTLYYECSKLEKTPLDSAATKVQRR